MSTPAAPPRPEEPVVPKRRNTELVLSLFAVGIAMFAYANVGLADNGKIPAGMFGYGLGLAAIVGCANLLIRYAAPYADPLLLPLATLLNGVGLVMIHRLDLHYQEVAKVLKDPIPAGSTTSQLMFTALGVAAFALFLLFIKDHKILQRYAYISMVSGLLLVAIPAALPNSISGANGAKSWIRFPGGISVQPAEFGKLLMVSFFAAFLVSKRDALRVASRKIAGLHIPRGRDMGPIAIVWGFAMAVLFLETDLGVSLMFFGAFTVLLYIATERTSWLLFGLIAFFGGAAVISSITPHVQTRVTAWLHPFDVEATNSGSNQIAQSIYAFATGGIFGKGLNQGRPYEVGFAANADFILDSVGEELGMIGFFALMIVYMLIVMRGFKTAILIRDNYGKLLASGLAVTFALQVFITAGGVMRVIPLTGLPMPFLAAGGSALVANWVLIAALIRLSDAARRPPPPAIPLTEDELRAMRLVAAVRMPSNAPAPAAAAVHAGHGPGAPGPADGLAQTPTGPGAHGGPGGPAGYGTGGVPSQGAETEAIRPRGPQAPPPGSADATQALSAGPQPREAAEVEPEDTEQESYDEIDDDETATEAVTRAVGDADAVTQAVPGKRPRTSDSPAAPGDRQGQTDRRYGA